MQREWCREVHLAFPWQFTVKGHLSITWSCIVTLLETVLYVCRYLYIHSKYSCCYWEIYNSDIHSCATAKHGLWFPGFHSASLQKTGQVQSTRFFYWTLMKKRCTRIRILNMPSILYHTYWTLTLFPFWQSNYIWPNYCSNIQRC